MVDLDGFKQVNDTFGHDAGDELLRQVAQRFRLALRSGDTVARTGGDEFILLFPGLDSAGSRPVCERILDALRADYAWSGRRLRIDASVGLASFPRDADEVVALTRKADEAMDAAKGEDAAIRRQTTRANEA